jgi:hypothetical protein
MKSSLRPVLATLCIAGSWVGGGLPAAAQVTPQSATASHDGLVRSERPQRFQAVWLRPGADLRGYSKLLVLPPEIHTASPSHAPREQRHALGEHQRARLEGAMRDVFEEEILEKGGWQLTSEPGPDVLIARAALIDVEVHVPDRRSTGRSATFVSSFGEATLVVEIFDSQSRQILARIADRRSAQPAGRRLQRVDVSVLPDVRRELRRWATRVRDALDLARTTPFPA